MKVKFLDSAVKDLIWFEYYYNSHFPDGKKKARQQYNITKSLIKKNPYIGHRTEVEGVREFSIPKIPFSLIYRIKNNDIEIINVWDERKER